MKGSKVYYSDSRAVRRAESLPLKMLRLFDEAGFADIINRGDIVAIKSHLSERYNSAYLRPFYVRLIVDKVRECGGKPFVTDTLSLGLCAHEFTKRDLNLYFETMAMNGFTNETVGAPIVIADAPAGHRGVPIEVNGSGVQTVSVAPALADADCLIGVAHFKGHSTSGFGGALKNLGVGGLYRGGRYHVHRDGPPEVSQEKCNACGECVPACPAHAISVVNGLAVIDTVECDLCSGCLEFCPQGAITAPYTDLKMSSVRIADGAFGVIKAIGQEKCAFINLAIDITPNCDCFPFADNPIVQDLGVLASRDPVALDQASVDMVTAAPGLPCSAAEECGVMAPGTEKFGPIGRLFYQAMYGPDCTMEPTWEDQLAEGEAVGMGVRKYELIKVNIEPPAEATVHR